MNGKINANNGLLVAAVPPVTIAKSKILDNKLIERMVNSEVIVQDVFKRKQNLFLSMKDDLFKERSHDFADLQKRILLELKGVESDVLSRIPEDSIIVAKRLLPSDTLHLKKKNRNGSMAGQV